MILYNIGCGTIITRVREKPFKLEKEIQTLFESNIHTIMGIELVKSECTIKNRRIDTLAFDSSSNSFVIIEYKRDRNTSVFDQGITYLSLMLQNKADFIIEYNEALNRKLRRQDVDWSQTRVVFVSTDFTENQIEATNFKDLSIELWTVKRFDNGTVAITAIQKSKTAESFKPLASKNKIMTDIATEIKVYTEEDALSGKPADIAELYSRFRSAIVGLADDIEVKPTKLYVAFKKNNHNITDIQVQFSALKIFINAKNGTLDDPKGLAKDISSVGHWGNGDYALQVSDDRDLEYIMSLVKQAVVSE